MEFEWDEEKSAANLAQRGFDFAFAAGIFEGPTFEEEDSRRDYGETRVRACGAARGVELIVVYTDRGDVRRIISARVANRKERMKWQSFVAR